MRFAAVLCVVLVGCAQPGTNQAPADVTPPPVAASVPSAPVVPAGVIPHDANDFTFEVIRKAAPASGDFLLSGFIARHAIGTLAAASPNRDAALKALHYASSVDQPGRAEENAWTTAARHVPFTSGERVFYEQSRPLSESFTKEAAERFGQTFEAVDLLGNAAIARHRMGAWASENAGRLLTGDVSASAVPDGTTLAIGTAFGLEAKWTKAFEIADTVDAPFTLASSAKRTVKMMRQTTSAPFAQMDDGTKLLDLSLGDTTDDLAGLSVLVVLPPKGTTLRAVESHLDRALYDSWQSKLETQTVHIEIPHVHVQKDFDLTPFARDVDTSHVFASGDSPRVRFVQGTVITFDEVGVKAAAASISQRTTASRQKPPPIPEFIANRPFFIFIHDHSSPIAPILLFGRIETPHGVTSHDRQD